MNHATTNPTKAPTSHGCDGPAFTRDGDHLNRWPLAREIHGIATSGPKGWAVRIGIYGEWGTGKTSVLKFIASMAEKAGHIVVWFDPWEHSSKPDLWRAFVIAVYKNLEAQYGWRRLGWVKGATKAYLKTAIVAGKNLLSKGASLASEKAGEFTDTGLDLVKGCFSFNAKDLQSFQEMLGEKRVIVLVDDLDRTAPELVPEILFTLKELMDIPGFSFICAFDPMVVGQVLGKSHPGFGDGLKFLEKIIDYPRWLPPPSTDGLVKLAIADASASCNFVPEQAIRDAVPLLPPNPRAVRQFIRLLALLKPQIERHAVEELRWPAIIAANIVKARHPHIAQALLSDNGFWDSIGMIGVTAKKDREEGEIEKAVDEQIEKTCKLIGVVLETPQKKEIEAAMLALTSQMGVFGGLHGESVSYHFNIAEAPAAVTWKEFDQFLSHWEANPVTANVKEWIASHASKVERSEVDVYREVLRAAIHRYGEALQRADNVLVEADRIAFEDKAKCLFALIESLGLDLAQPESIGYVELNAIVEKFASFARSRLPVHTQFWNGNEKFILKLFKNWRGDATLLTNVLQPYGFLPRGFEGEAAEELRNKLCALALPPLARHIINRLRESGFVKGLTSRQDGAVDSRQIIWDGNGLFGNSLHPDTFALLAEAPLNPAVQENAYELFHWFVLARVGRAPRDPNMDKIFSDQANFDAIWNAAVATPLGPRAVYQLKDLPEITKLIGIKFEPPGWWAGALVSAGIIKAPPPAAGEQAQ